MTLHLAHPDGLCGFPGNISCEVRYALAEGALQVEITGRSDVPTVFNPAFHGYWNIGGTPTVLEHRMQIDADHYLPVDAALIPIGAPATVAGSVFDYRTPAAPDAQIDHNYCLPGTRGEMRRALSLFTEDLRLDVETTEIGLQIYTGAGIDTAPHAGHDAAPYGPNAGIAIEPQLWPDSPNRPDYPSAALQPGETYRQVSRFTVTRLNERA